MTGLGALFQARLKHGCPMCGKMEWCGRDCPAAYEARQILGLPEPDVEIEAPDSANTLHMKERVCVTCGGPLPDQRGFRRYCGPGCRPS